MGEPRGWRAFGGVCFSIIRLALIVDLGFTLRRLLERIGQLDLGPERVDAFCGLIEREVGRVLAWLISFLSQALQLQYLRSGHLPAQPLPEVAHQAMDNRINEIKRQISALRLSMVAVEDSIRGQINHDLDCTDASLRLMTMRTEMATLIADLRAAGGVDPMPTFRERMAENYRQPSRRPASSTK
jgi:hypothetical protein